MSIDDLPLLRQELTLAIRDGIVAGLSEVKSLRAELDAARADAESWEKQADDLAADAAQFILERDAMRSCLLELRIRLHAAGRRPEECYELSIIDDALAGEKK